MEYTISTLIAEDELKRKISELGKIISRSYEGKELVMICVLKGAVYFFTELTKHITVPVVLDFTMAASYGSGMVSKGDADILLDYTEDLRGRHVIVVEDIVDTGITLSKLMDRIKKEEPASLKLAAMLNKPEKRKIQIDIDYCGFDVPDKFVVGFGLDFDQKYRNLPFIGAIEGR